MESTAIHLKQVNINWFLKWSLHKSLTESNEQWIVSIRIVNITIYRVAHEMSHHWLCTQHIFIITKAFDIWYRINPHRLENCS